MMVEYIRNVNGKFFEKKSLEKASDKQIKIMIKRCFWFVQKKLKQQYNYWLEDNQIKM